MNLFIDLVSDQSQCFLSRMLVKRVENRQREHDNSVSFREAAMGTNESGRPRVKLTFFAEKNCDIF